MMKVNIKYDLKSKLDIIIYIEDILMNMKQDNLSPECEKKEEILQEKDILNCSDKDRILNSLKSIYEEKKYIDIIELVSNEGIIVKVDNTMKQSAYIQKDGNNITIYINGGHKLSKQRFSIAHELSHFVLHKNELESRSTIDRDGENSLDQSKEDEANEFAGEILMPREILVDLLSKEFFVQEGRFVSKDIIEKLADRFKVSFYAMIVRLRVIGYNIPYIELY